MLLDRIIEGQIQLNNKDHEKREKQMILETKGRVTGLLGQNFQNFHGLCCSVGLDLYLSYPEAPDLEAYSFQLFSVEQSWVF